MPTWGVIALIFGPLAALTAAVVALNERADRREHEATELAEAAAKGRTDMPLGHPESLTVALAPADEMWLAALDEELDPEAAE